MPKLPSLSVFFPCYNEAENIPLLVSQALDYLPSIAKQFEIIIVNDGSTDATVSVVQKLAASHPEIRLVSHATNKGYGAALKTGIQSASYSWIFWSDGDLQFDISTLDLLVPHVDRYDAIIGYRAHRADTFLRKVNGELYTQLINVLFHLRVRDIDCAFKLIRAERLHALSITTSSAFTSAEILIRLKRNGVRFKQISVPHFKRRYGTPTGGSLRVIFKGLRQTLQFFLAQSYGPQER